MPVLADTMQALDLLLIIGNVHLLVIDITTFSAKARDGLYIHEQFDGNAIAVSEFKLVAKLNPQIYVQTKLI